MPAARFPSLLPVVSSCMAECSCARHFVDKRVSHRWLVRRWRSNTRRVRGRRRQDSKPVAVHRAVFHHLRHLRLDLALQPGKPVGEQRFPVRNDVPGERHDRADVAAFWFAAVRHWPVHRHEHSHQEHKQDLRSVQ